MAYVAQAGKKKQFVVVDGKEGKEYDGIMEDSLIFSPASLHYLALEDDSIYLVDE